MLRSSLCDYSDAFILVKGTITVANTAAGAVAAANITNKKAKNGTKNVEIMVLLKYLSNVGRTLEMPLINCEINIDLNWSKKYIIAATNVAAQARTFSITDTKLYVLVVTLSTEDNAKLLEQLKSGFKRTINWNKYQSQKSTERPNQYLDYLIDPGFPGVKRLFVLPFQNERQQISYKRYYLSTVEIMKYNFTIDRQNFFDQPVRNISITYKSIQKIAAGEGKDCTSGCLLDYNYFKNYYNMIAIDLSN